MIGNMKWCLASETGSKDEENKGNKNIFWSISDKTY